MQTDGAGTWVDGPQEPRKYLEGKLRWDAAVLRQYWKQAGVHIYLDTDEVIYAGHQWITLHTIQGGSRTVRFPYKAKVIEPLTNRVLETGTDSLRIELPASSTTILRVMPAGK